ncbi:thioesterase II family protein [Streptomyces chattanoogensis]|uniref:thioesterase II family protein n=1 Tax=Streptomyces chattanoogensis TaxID=66876 RepID=UPI003687E5C9
MTPSPWLTGIPTADPALRLFLFPHAGGAASAYAHWLDRGGDALEIRSVQYPGREARLRERPLHSIGELADGLARAIAAERPGPPCVFFGHSMGALVAFEVAKRLRDLGLSGPERLFAAACAAPQTPRRTTLGTLTDDLLAAWLIREDPSCAEALAHPELAALVLPALRADLTAVETYRPTPGPPLDCPVTVLTGSDDTLHGVAVTGWRDHTTDEFRHHEFPGGHFFVRTSEREVMNLMEDLMEDLMKGLTRDL